MVQPVVTTAAGKKPSRENPLHQLIRQALADLIADALDEELQHFLQTHAELRTDDGLRAIVRNGYLPERILQTVVGDIAIRVPRARDRSHAGPHFTSVLIPPYLKRLQNKDPHLPRIYLQDCMAGDFSNILAVLLGKYIRHAADSAASCLQGKWQSERHAWGQRDLRHVHYLYWWAESIPGNVDKGEPDLMAIVGITEQGSRELLAVGAGTRESEAQWLALLQELQKRGLKNAPRMADTPNAPGFLQALALAFAETAGRRSGNSGTDDVETAARPLLPEIRYVYFP